MTIKKLITEIAKRENKKKSVSIGNIREVIGILSDIFYKEYEENCNSLVLLDSFIENGRKRAKKKK